MTAMAACAIVGTLAATMVSVPGVETPSGGSGGIPSGFAYVAAAGSLAAWVTGWWLTPRALAGREDGLWMGVATYLLGIPIGLTLLFAPPAAATLVGFDVRGVVGLALQTTILLTVGSVFAATMLLPVFLLCLPLGFLWAVVVRTRLQAPATSTIAALRTRPAATLLALVALVLGCAAVSLLLPGIADPADWIGAGEID